MMQKLQPGPPAHRNQLHCGHQRTRDGPKATTVPSLFQKLQLRGPKRTVITCNAAISACAEGKHAKPVPRMFQKLELRGLLRTVITYNVDISACEKGQQPQRALQILG